MFVEVSVVVPLLVPVEGELFVVVDFDGLQLNTNAVRATVIATNMRFMGFNFFSK